MLVEPNPHFYKFYFFITELVHCKQKFEYTDKERRLYDFIGYNNIPGVKKLVSDVNWKNIFGRTPLHHAVRHGLYDVIKVLLKRFDILPNKRNDSDFTPLMVAAMFGYTVCVDLLVQDHRVDVNVTTNNGASALWFAYYNDKIHVIKLLISHGANIEGIVDSVCEFARVSWTATPQHTSTKVMDNWKSYLCEFTRYAKSNKYYPREFKERAKVFILCCVRMKRRFPKDIIYLLLEYIARAWKNN